MTIFRATSVAEAVEHALAGKRDGRWDFFRGHADAGWRVRSTAARLSDEGRDDALQQFVRFVAWAKREPAMSTYLQEPDAMWAIAQHYGLATSFIDFTDDPRVAAFFACVAEKEPCNPEAAIICVDSGEFARFWESLMPFLKPRYPDLESPEFIHLDVANLWRLQKQRGCFLWSVVANMEEHLFSFDRIIFPRDRGAAILPRHDEIYPKDQSELEKLLTRFFMDEAMRKGTESIMRMNIQHIVMNTTDKDYEASSWIKGGIPLSDEWRDSSQWNARPIEHADDALQGAPILLPADLNAVAERLFRVMTTEFIEANRNRTLAFEFEGGVALRPRLVACARRLWNGMRTLPYSAAEIRTAIEQTIALYPASCAEQDPAKAFPHRGLYVEMSSSGSGEGAYSRATVTEQAFLAALNPVFRDAVSKSLTNPDMLLYACLRQPARPWERFTFSGLRSLMVAQMIPTQVTWRVWHEGNDALRTSLFFSPTEIKVFGLA